LEKLAGSFTTTRSLNLASWRRSLAEVMVVDFRPCLKRWLANAKLRRVAEIVVLRMAVAFAPPFEADR
jgi:hypothetical protein